MKKRRPKRKFSSPRKKASHVKRPRVEYLLEHGTIQNMRMAKEQTKAMLKYNWDYYSDLARQRNQIQEDLKKALIQASISNFKIDKWQRAVKWKYGLHPLSTVGSLSYIGNRFNTGKDVNSAVPNFPALYLASDKDTALQETLGQIEVKNSSLSARELALTNSQSEVIVSVSGELEKVFDLRSADSLEGFVELIKNFKLSKALEESAKFLGLAKPDLVKRADQLLETLLAADWQKAPSQFDVPSNSQIFGHLIYQAGIEGILYPSKLTGKDCLVIFIHNFLGSSSYLAFDDEPPHPDVPRRIDSDNWRICDLVFSELNKKA